MWNTPSLPLLPVPLWPRVVAPDRVLSVGHIEETVQIDGYRQIKIQFSIEDLGNVEYPFIAIAPQSILARCDSTW